MQVKFSYLHSTIEAPTGKRKKQKVVVHTAEHSVEIREFQANQVPIAWVETIYGIARGNQPEPHYRTWLWFENQLWTAEPLSTFYVETKYETPKSEYSYYQDAHKRSIRLWRQHVCADPKGWLSSRD